jgi:RNA polymerase sigma factor (sigma-70 family)
MMFIKNAKWDSLQMCRDEELLDAFRRTRETHYFAFLFDRHAKNLYDFCHGYLDHEEDSRDIVMQIFSKSLEHASRQAIHNFKSWLFFLARNECINYLRDRERHNDGQLVFTYLQNVGSTATEGKGHEENPELRLGRALSRLRTKQRACIELFYFENKSYREIAKLTNCSLKEVKSNLQNGKRKLKKLVLTAQSPGSY